MVSPLKKGPEVNLSMVALKSFKESAMEYGMKEGKSRGRVGSHSLGGLRPKIKE